MGGVHHNATYIITLGLLWGNGIGFALLWLQQQYGIVKLDPATYYVSQVPIAIPWVGALLVNVGVLVVCLLMLLLPSFVIAKISPTKAMKFD